MLQLKNRLNAVAAIYDQYEKRVSQIETYIRNVDAQKSFLEDVSGISFSEEAQQYIYTLSSLQNSVVLYNAAIISIYGSYELFLDELLKTYIQYLEDTHSNYLSLPIQIRNKHLEKSIEFIGNPQRFLNMGLDKNSVIRNLHDTENEDKIHCMTKDLLLSHGGNMRSDQLYKLFAEFGIENINAKLKKHRRIVSFFHDNGLDAELVGGSFSLLDRVVEERNKVAHGWTVDERISFQVLLGTYIPFMKELCAGARDAIISEIIKDYADQGALSDFNPIKKLYLHGTVVGVNCGDFYLKTGEPIFFRDTAGWYFSTEILELQKDKKTIQIVRSSNKDIGIKVACKIRETDTVMGFRR